MKRTLLFYVCLCFLTLPMKMMAQEWQKEGVGKKGDVYTLFKITAPAPAQLPEKVSKSIAKQLFDTTGVTINEGIKAYLAQYDEVLPASKKNVEQAGYRRQSFNIQWYDYVDGHFASLLVEVQKYNDKGKREKNRHKPMVFNLTSQRALKMEDVFTDSAMAEILATGERHQFYINQVGVVKVRYRVDKKWEEEDYSTNGEKELFQPSFLALVNKEGIEQNDALADALEGGGISKKAGYPGGKEGVLEYFHNNMRWPRQAFENKRFLEIEMVFEVDPNGRVSDARLVNPVHPLIDDELISVAKRMKGWRPEVKDGKRVKSSFKMRWVYRHPQWSEK